MATAPNPAKSAEAAADTPARPEDDPRFDPAEEFVRPPDEDFWEKYSKRLEFPTSWVGAILVWVMMGLLYFAASKYLFNKSEGEVPVRILEVGGLDDEGEGSAGMGGTMEPIVQVDDKAFDVQPEVKENDPLDKPSENLQVQIQQAKAPPLKRGIGGGKGGGTGDTPGDGPGGTGNDKTWKRGIGWTLKFKFTDARDFCKQLAAAEAVIFVPEGGIDSKNGTLYADMNNPTVGRPADKGDPIFNGRLGLYEQEPAKIRKMLQYLGAPNGRTYGVFFPKKFQDELAQKEIGHRNRRPEDIENTVFSFSVRGGEYEIIVVDQRVRK